MSGIFLLLLSFLTLYNAYTPKVGPIGNGLNFKIVWIQFSTQLISGISAFFLAYNLGNKK